MYLNGFPDGSVVKKPPANEEEAGWIPGLGRFPGEGNGNPFQYSCQENPMDLRAWSATVHELAESETTEPLSMNTVCSKVTNGPQTENTSNSK